MGSCKNQEPTNTNQNQDKKFSIKKIPANICSKLLKAMLITYIHQSHTTCIGKTLLVKTNVV
jgi:hypothetical protein